MIGFAIMWIVEHKLIKLNFLIILLFFEIQLLLHHFPLSFFHLNPFMGLNKRRDSFLIDVSIA